MATKEENMKITFLGAASSVTGSCHLITTDKYKILLDCGQFQGNKSLEAMNYEEFGFDPTDIDFMLLSHAHVDHCGRIPLLTKRGFTSPIYCTDATADLVEVMLKDSGYIHEKEMEWENRKAERAGRPQREPLYTLNDAVGSLEYVKPILYEQIIEVVDGIKVRFTDAGHILGSAIIEIWITELGNETKIVFSGDLGVKGRPILKDPKFVDEADYLIMETTYGNRVHEESKKSLKDLIDIILKTTKRGGSVIIPSFAVGRTQELIYWMHRFYEGHEEYRQALDDIFVYVDSPMAKSATEVFRKNAQVFDDETRDYILSGDNPLDFKNLKFVRSSQDSMTLNMSQEPKIIISASGMCDAGRIKHHLKHNLWNKKNSVVFVGYQAEGTLGRSIRDGEKDVTIFGEKIHINAEIYNLDGFSGHADKDGLLEWVSGFEKPPRKIFLVHGEQDSKDAFAYAVKEKLGYECVVIEDVCEYDLIEEAARPIDGELEKKKRIETAQKLIDIKDRLSKVHDEVETILYNASLAIDGSASLDRLTAIQNIILGLEKDTINLGATLSLGDNQE